MLAVFTVLLLLLAYDPYLPSKSSQSSQEIDKKICNLGTQKSCLTQLREPKRAFWRKSWTNSGLLGEVRTGNIEGSSGQGERHLQRQQHVQRYGATEDLEQQPLNPPLLLSRPSGP